MTNAVLQLLGVTKTYMMGETQVHALKGITMEIAQGDMVSIMGPSGCGKSTMLQIAGCLDKPSSGRVRVGGSDIMSLDDQQLAKIRNKHIGFIFQSFNLLPHENALNNVLVPIQYSGVSRKQGEAAAKRSLEAVGLGDRIHHRPNELSGGQRQAVAIARALRSMTNVGMTALEEISDFGEIIDINENRDTGKLPQARPKKIAKAEKKEVKSIPQKQDQAAQATSENPPQSQATPPSSGNGNRATETKKAEGNGNGRGKSKQETTPKISSAQANAIANLSRRRGISVEELEKMAVDTFGVKVEHLSQKDASALIRQLQQSA